MSISSKDGPAPPLELTRSRREIEQRSLGDQIAQVLLDDILFGRLPAGAILAQNGLCERFSTSRMPVRDALIKLEHEGFVRRTARNNVKVVAITGEDIESAFQACAFLGGLTAARAVSRIRDDDLAVLRERNRLMREALARKDYQAIADLNWEFHRTINIAADSPSLLAALRGLSALIPRRFIVAMPGYGELSIGQHDDLIQALESGSPGAVREIAAKHVLDAGEQLLSVIGNLRRLPAALAADTPESRGFLETTTRTTSVASQSARES